MSIETDEPSQEAKGKQAKSRKLNKPQREREAAIAAHFSDWQKLRFVPDKDGGFIQLPRTVPLVARLIDTVGGREKAGPLYQALWARSWNGFVRVNNPIAIVYEAGGNASISRAHRTWRERMTILKQLGFAVSKSLYSAHGDDLVLLLNPALVVPSLSDRLESEKLKSAFQRWLPPYLELCREFSISAPSEEGQ